MTGCRNGRRREEKIKILCVAYYCFLFYGWRVGQSEAAWADDFNTDLKVLQKESGAMYVHMHELAGKEYYAVHFPLLIWLI